MPKPGTKVGTKSKKTTLEKAQKAEKPVLCGHEEVQAAEKQEDKVFRCGLHGDHKLSECQRLCV